MTDKEFKKEILPLILKVREKCAEKNVPFFACFIINPMTDERHAELLSPALLDIEMPNNIIQKFLNVYNGFDTVPPNEILEIDFSNGDADLF